MKLRKGFARLLYDMFEGRLECFRDYRGLFPHAQSFKLYGYGFIPVDPMEKIEVYYCPKCREAEKRWWAARRTRAKRVL